MTQRTIEITFSPSGEIKIDAIGFACADCEKATAFLEKALGMTKARTRKPEYYRKEANRRVQRLEQ